MAVNDKVHDNLELLHAAFSQDAIEGIFSGEVYERDGVEFVSKYAQGSTAERFFIVKPLPFIEYFVEFCRDFQGGSIFELGIAEGGSTALLALIAHPRKLVAVDLEPQRLAALDDFAASRGFSDTMKLHYGVDQQDRMARLQEIVVEEYGAGQLDLVLDDASHQLGPTRASFEALFPYLRPGGVYTIEDWNADQRFRDAILARVLNPETPEDVKSAASFREQLVRERTESTPRRRSRNDEPDRSGAPARVRHSEVVAEVTVNEHWIIVRRGAADIDPSTFRLADLYQDYYGFLPTAP